MLPEYFAFLGGHLGVTIVCMVIAVCLLLVKILVYNLWKRQVTEVEAKVLDIRMVSQKGGLKYARGYILAVRYFIDGVEQIGYLFKQARFNNMVQAPEKMNVYFSKSGLTKAIRSKDNMTFRYSILIAVEGFITSSVISNIILFFCSRYVWVDMLMLAVLLLTLTYYVRDTMMSSVTWDKVYRCLYMERSIGYKYCGLSGGAVNRFDKVYRLDDKLRQEGVR